MTDAPERIWAFMPEVFDNMSVWQDAPSSANDTIEYVCADLVPRWSSDMEAAPKDGTRLMLWRGETDIGSWSELIVAQWHEGAWRWPDPRDNPSKYGPWTDDDMMEGYADDKNFTHWMPLPAPPKGET